MIAENVAEKPVTWGVELCDRCGVRAQYLAFKDDNMLLTFCGHHGQVMQLALLGAGWEVDVLDE